MEAVEENVQEQQAGSQMADQQVSDGPGLNIQTMLENLILTACAERVGDNVNLQFCVCPRPENDQAPGSNTLARPVGPVFQLNERLTHEIINALSRAVSPV